MKFFKRESLEWKRRTPDYMARKKGRIRAALIVFLFLVYMIAGFYSNNVVGILFFSVFWLLTWPKMIKVTPMDKFIADEIAPLEEMPGKDIPVQVTYLLEGVQLGIDRGYLGLRQEGLSFNGIETTFLIAPREENLKAFLSDIDGPVVSALLTEVHEKYVIQFEPLLPLGGRKPLEAAVDFKKSLTADRSDTPPSTIHNRPPLTASPSLFFRIQSELLEWFGIAAFVPGGAILLLLWIAAHADHLNVTRGAEIDTLRVVSIVGTVLFLVILGLLVVAFREIIPTLLRRYHVFLKLDKEALIGNTKSPIAE